MSDIMMISVYEIGYAKQWLYDLLKERSTEEDRHVNISHRQLPSWEDHVAFIDSMPYERWFVIVDQTGVSEFKCLGTCYVTKRNEIGVHLFKHARGRGIGTAAVKELMERKPLPAEPGVRHGQYIANINPNNQASIRMFEKLGFRHIQNTYQLEE